MYAIHILVYLDVICTNTQFCRHVCVYLCQLQEMADGVVALVRCCAGCEGRVRGRV